MKFRIQVKDKGAPDSEARWEEYEENTDDPRAWAEDTLKWFNETLRPHETARELLKVEVLDTHSVKNHTWRKTSPITQYDPRHGDYDAMKCERCGVVARRYGINRYVRQRPYKSKKFERCDSALKELAEEV